MQAPFSLFGALNVPYRIIELLHTNRHRELLSGRSGVRITSGTPKIGKYESACRFYFLYKENLFNFRAAVADAVNKERRCISDYIGVSLFNVLLEFINAVITDN